MLKVFRVDVDEVNLSRTIHIYCMWLVLSVDPLYFMNDLTKGGFESTTYCFRGYYGSECAD